MRELILFGFVMAFGCGGRVDTPDSGSPADANIDANPPDAAAPPQKDASPSPDGSPCGATLCGAACVDTQADPLNCGTCGNVCDGGSCSSGQCVNDDAPPQGTCAHSLCATGAHLEEGCDPTGCTTTICDPAFLGDKVCCADVWDTTCLDEVTQYCPPFACH